MTGLASLRQTLAVALSAVVLALALAGEAAAVPDITLEPVAGLAFGNVLVGSAAPGAVGVFNDGTSAGTIGAISLSGDPSFSIALDDCAGLTLQADEFCVVDLAFAPTIAGAAAAQLSVASDAPGSPDLLALSGTGVAPPPPPPPPGQAFTATPTALDFGIRTVGTARAATKTIHVKAVVGVTSVLSRLGGPDAGAFRVTSRCAALTAPATGCSLTVSFVPEREGAHAATLVLEAGATSQAVALSGIGAAPRPRPTLPVGPPVPAPRGTKPSKAETKQALWETLGKPTVRWNRLGRKATRKAKAFALRAPALGRTGSLRLELRTADARKRLVASGTVAYPRSNAKVLTARLTRVGKTLLGRSGKRRLRAILAFTDTDGAVIRAARSFTLPD